MKSTNHIPNHRTIDDLSNLFKLFSDPTRVKLLFTIKDNELCVHEISKILKLCPSAVSHQLKTLRQNKIVSVRREGRHAFYCLNDKHIFDILDIGLTHISHK